IPKAGGGGLGAPRPGAGGAVGGALTAGAVTDGEAPTNGTCDTTSPGFLILVGKVRMRRVPGSAFSATAPPPWAARMVLTSANFKPVPANWGEAGCLGS